MISQLSNQSSLLPAIEAQLERADGDCKQREAEEVELAPADVGLRQEAQQQDSVQMMPTGRLTRKTQRQL